MRIFKHKKGTWNELVMQPMMQLIIVFAVIFLPLFGYVYTATDFDLMARHYIARDTALLVDTMQSVSGNVLFRYKEKTLGNSMNLSENGIYVYDEAGNKIRSRHDHGFFPFLTGLDYEIKPSHLKPFFKPDQELEEQDYIKPFLCKSGNELSMLSQANECNLNKPKLEVIIKPFNRIKVQKQTAEYEETRLAEDLLLELEQNQITITDQVDSLTLLIVIKSVEGDKVSVFYSEDTSRNIANIFALNLETTVTKSDISSLKDTKYSVLIEFGKEKEHNELINKIVESIK